MAHPLAFYNMLQSSNTRLVGNMYFPDSPGHMITELDNFLRMRHLGEIESNCNYLAILRKGVLNLPETIVAMLPDVFNPESRIQIMVNDELARLAQEVHLAYPEMAVDVGTSHFKTVLTSAEDRKKARLWHLPRWPRSYVWLLAQQQAHDCSLNYYRRRAASRDYVPFATIPELSPELRQFLGEDDKPLALVHIRNTPRAQGHATNAGNSTSSEVMLPTLAYLHDMGYKVVKIGREPFPPEWASSGVLNYSNSPLLNYRNDMLLLKAAQFVMINASGFGNLPDILGTPMVYYGVWQINSLVSSRNCVLLPTLMRHRESGRLLKFIEQMKVVRSLPEYWDSRTPSSFPCADYDERFNTADELLAAAQEAITLGRAWYPRSPQQEQFFDLDRDYSFRSIDGRVGQFFLERFSDALEPKFSSAADTA